MMNLSSLSKGLFALLLSTTLAFGGGIWLALKGEVAIAALFGSTTLLSLLAILALSRTQNTIRHASYIAREIGKGDFEKRADESLDAGDLLQLLTSINFLVDRADGFNREVIASVQAISNNKFYRRIVEVGMLGGFAANAKRTNAAIEKIQHRIADFTGRTASFEEAIGSIVGNLTSSGGELSQTAQMMESSATSTSERASVVASASVETSTNVQTVSAAVEQLSASSREIGNQVGRSAEAATAAVEQAKLGQTRINSLNEAAQAIGNVVEIINDVAERTNLLALNATIEAARAGEAGKGFAVVASEVKELSGQTGKAIDEISGQIKQMQLTTREAVGAFEEVTNSISRIEEITTIVANAAEEQNLATAEIAQNVEQALAGTQEVSENITGVSNSASQTGESAETVKMSSDKMNKSAEILTSEIAEFMMQLRMGPLDRREHLESDYQGQDRRTEHIHGANGQAA